MVNTDNASTPIFSLPWIYYISGPKSSNVSLHLNTLFVSKMLHVRFHYQYVFLINLPSDTAQNCFDVSMATNSFLSVTVHLV